MNQQEQRRLLVLNEVIGGKLTAGRAAEVRRILAAYRKEGAAALAHGNRGRRPAHTVAAAVRAQVGTLATTKYQGFNHQHLSEKLNDDGIQLARSTVRRILGGAGFPSPRPRRPPKHRRRRERSPQEGLLLQIDGSPHDWLEGRGPRLTLLAAIDDATGTVPAARFREQEDAHGYFRLLEGIILTKGIPGARYHDRHGIFERSLGEAETIAEQSAGRREPTSRPSRPAPAKPGPEHPWRTKATVTRRPANAQANTQE